MKRKFHVIATAGIILAGIAATGLLFSQRPPGPMGFATEPVLTLRNWFLQSSEKVQAGGETLSRPGYLMNRWFPATVPSTVMGTLVQNNVYPDVFLADNLGKISEEPFRVSWWYRTEFPLAADPGKGPVRIVFDGISYRANVWLNGVKIADASEAFGPFRRFEFDAMAAAIRGGNNVLAVEVFPPKPGEPGIGFADWNPVPPDKSMGLWREVRVLTSGEVSIHDPFVRTKLDLGTSNEARLTVGADIRNNASYKISGTLEGRVESAQFSQDVTLEPGETRKIVFTPEAQPELVFKNPRLWWTHDTGKPSLYLLSLTFKIKIDPKAAKEMKKTETAEEKPGDDEKKKDRDGPGRRGDMPRMARSPFSDVKVVRFGIREVSSVIYADGRRGFLLNGKKLLIRGAGWTDDIFLDNRTKKVAAQVAYARHMNLNALRLEGFWGSNEDLCNFCDDNGILILAGWSCQWEWENLLGKPTDPKYGGILSDEEIKLASRSWRDQIRRLRNHPSILVWLEGSDLLPSPELEKEYRKILDEDDPERPVLASAKDLTSAVSGPTGVKMNGPYDWVPPAYWYTDTKNGGAFGFNTESGPGPQIPPVESLKKMIPENELWPIGPSWNFHSARGKFGNLDRFNEAMARRLGPPENLEDYERKAQFMNYEGVRAMFEAFVANKPRATGVIHWMLNAAWPKLWWQLFDYYLMPNGSFYGARKAGTPLHILFNYGTGDVMAVNNGFAAASDLKASLRVLDIDLREIHAREIPLALAGDEVKVLERLPASLAANAAFFLDLRLKAKDGTLLSVNFYCLPPKSEVLDEAAATWYVTPVREYGDLTALQKLPPVALKTKASFKKGALEQTITAEVENPGPSLALNVEINVYEKSTGELVLPVFWEDNFITLLPGEKRKIRGFFFPDDLGGGEPELRARGWNIR